MLLIIILIITLTKFYHMILIIMERIMQINNVVITIIKFLPPASVYKSYVHSKEIIQNRLVCI